MARSSVRIVVSLALTAVLLAFFLWRVDLAEVGKTMASADPLWLLLSVALALLTYWLRVLRWLLILRPVGGIRHSSALLATASGYAAMALLPARMGDLVRPLLLARRDHRPASALLASILTERILDFGTVIAFFLVFVLWPPPMAQLTEQGRTDLRILGWTGAAFGVGLAVGVALVLALLRYQERLVRVLTTPLARFGPRWQGGAANFLHHFLDGLRALQRPRDLALIVGASLLLWYVIYWQVQVNLIAFSIHLPLRAAFLLVTLAVIGLAIPTPAGAGGFHKATQIGLTQFFGVELGRATGYAIVYHAICFLPITIIGLLCLPAFGVSLRQVDRLTSQAKDEATTTGGTDPGENV